ncbi:MAG: hypothetical protein ACXWEH_05020 [Actinomycetota bacterium]
MGLDGRLHVYLNDHLAGSAAAIRLVRRRRDEGRAGELGEHLRGLLGEVEDDRGVLERVMASVGARPSPLKQSAAIGAEFMTRLKHVVPVVGSGSGEVALLEDLELLSLGIEGKRLLWRVLAAQAASDDRLREFDFAELEDRAARQRDGLERFRLDAASKAFDG